MPRIRIPKGALLDPGESDETIVITEEAIYCDGGVCGGQTIWDENGQPDLLPPHWHLIESGRFPDAGPWYYPIW